jgi:hypothetical protein
MLNMQPKNTSSGVDFLSYPTPSAFNRILFLLEEGRALFKNLTWYWCNSIPSGAKVKEVCS